MGIPPGIGVLRQCGEVLARLRSTPDGLGDVRGLVERDVPVAPSCFPLRPTVLCGVGHSG